MLRHFGTAQDRRKFLAIFLIGFWLLMPVNLFQSDPDFLDGMEQKEPVESRALDPGSDTYRAKRRLSVEAALPWISGGGGR